jgi:hypothetical protein
MSVSNTFQTYAITPLWNQIRKIVDQNLFEENVSDVTKVLSFRLLF